MLLVVFITGCKKDTFKEDIGLCPAVLSTNPTNGATNVPVNQSITVTFNEAMNPSTIGPSAFEMVDPGSNDALKSGKETSAAIEVNGTVAYNVQNNTMSFTPTVKLAANTTFTCKVQSTVKDLHGNALQAAYVWTFSTGSILSPTVIATDPSDKGTCVPLGKIVAATFSVPMDSFTINNATFLVTQGTTQINGNVSYTGSIASFTPTSALVTGSIYTATITTGVKNKSGISLQNNYVWIFTVGCNSVPVVISTDPTNNAINVVRNKIITVTFSDAMDNSTIMATTFVVKYGTVTVPGTFSYLGEKVTFTPSSNLLSGTTYTVTITTGVKNASGISLASEYAWTFSTIEPLVATVNLKSVIRFGIIAGVGISNNAGFSVINDLDVGISPGVRSSITGFPPAVDVNGMMYASDDIAPPGVPAMLIQAKQDLTDAYLFAEGAISPAPATVAGDIGGTTLAPGIYKSTSTLLIQSGNLTLDAKGDVNAVWIFQIASDFTTVGGAGGNVILSGGAQAKNIFWQVGSSATIGDYTSFKGNVLALTDITMNAYATAVGRMLARNGAVVMTSTNTISKP